MKFAFIEAEKARWPVDTLCDVLGVSRSGYYAWKVRPSCPPISRLRRNARLHEIWGRVTTGYSEAIQKIVEVIAREEDAAA